MHLKKWMKPVANHIEQSKRSYVFLLIFFAFSCFIGALYASFITLNDTTYLDNMVTTLCAQNVNYHNIFTNAVIGHSKIVFFLWLFGITFLGIVFAYFTICYKGFSVGFTIGVLAKYYAGKGTVIAFTYIIPQFFITVPVYFFLCMCVIRASSLFSFSARRRSHRVPEVGFNFLKYSLTILFACAILLLFSLGEGYIFPVFSRFILSLAKMTS